MIRFIAFLLIFFNLEFLFSQELKITAKEIAVDSIHLDTFEGYDDMQNLYFIKNNVLYKKNKKESWEYKNIALGKITKIDLQNQLRILLFYDNFNTVVLLDNQLNETQRINFTQNEIPIIANAAGIASQNSLWLYNSLTQEIGLYDYLKNSFKPVSQPITGEIKHYKTDFNTFQWIDNQLNWYVLDYFGKIRWVGKVPQYDQIQLLNDNEVMYKKDQKLYFLNLNKKQNYSIENMEKTFVKFFYKDQILSIFTTQKIINFKIAIP